MSFTDLDTDASNKLNEYIINLRQNAAKCMRPNVKSGWSTNMLRCEVKLQDNEINNNNLCKDIEKLLIPLISSQDSNYTKFSVCSIDKINKKLEIDVTATVSFKK